MEDRLGYRRFVHGHAQLARSKPPESAEYLKKLAAKQDSEFASVAIEALASIQITQTTRE